MILGVRTTGATRSDVAGLVAWCVELGERYYGRHREAVRIDRLPGIVYSPDPLSETVLLVGACVIDRATPHDRIVVSCGSAAAAYVAHCRSRGLGGRVTLRRLAAGRWHAVAELRGGRVWDPVSLALGRMLACGS